MRLSTYGGSSRVLNLRFLRGWSPELEIFYASFSSDFYIEIIHVDNMNAWKLSDKCTTAFMCKIYDK